jgi:hypothetical protein
MLHACDYPWELKQRIASSHGHLSNLSCAELLMQIYHPALCHLVLGHLSENSNTPELALSSSSSALAQAVFAAQARGQVALPPHLSCGSVSASSPLFAVEPELQQLKVQAQELSYAVNG